jgi:hypothetical protein
MGVNATWALLDTLTPAVPFFKRVVSLVENSFDLRHSTKHSQPNADIDIAGLVRMYKNGKIFDFRPSRTNLAQTNTPKDPIALGFKACDEGYLRSFIQERLIYQKHANTKEDYSYPLNIDNDLEPPQGSGLTTKQRKEVEQEADGALAMAGTVGEDGEGLLWNDLDAFEMDLEVELEHSAESELGFEDADPANYSMVLD